MTTPYPHRELTKTYGRVTALDGLDLEIALPGMPACRECAVIGRRRTAAQLLLWDGNMT
jgi:hypothetical protein